MRDYCDPHMAVLLSESGPFKGCEPTRHSPYELQALAMLAPPSWETLTASVRGVALAGVAAGGGGGEAELYDRRGREPVRGDVRDAVRAGPARRLGERLARRGVLGRSGPARTGSRRWCSTTSRPRPRTSSGRSATRIWRRSTRSRPSSGPTSLTSSSRRRRLDAVRARHVRRVRRVGHQPWRAGGSRRSPGRDLHRGAVPARERRAGATGLTAILAYNHADWYVRRSRRPTRCATAASTGSRT